MLSVYFSSFNSLTILIDRSDGLETLLSLFF